MSLKPWTGASVVCLASGPSLTTVDVGLVKAWRSQETNRFVVVCNTTYQIAPWADALFAMDAAWWMGHYADVRQRFAGDLYTVNNIGKQFAQLNTMPRPFTAYGNSGAGAIRMAATFGASRIILLGYDCSHGKDGKRHWHGNHPAGLGNADSFRKWPGQFQKLKDSLQNVKVVNCSRKTALFVFPCGTLEEELCSQPTTRLPGHCRQRLFA